MGQMRGEKKHLIEKRRLVNKLFNGVKPCETHTKMLEFYYANVLDLCDLIFLTLTLQIVMKD